MMISTKGRYALRVMLDLASHCSGGYIPMKSVAEREDLSLKYIEKIMPLLTKAHLVEGIHGRGGGYRLTREPEDYTVWEILCLTEGDLAPVGCLEADAAPCERAGSCPTLDMWKNFYRLTMEYFQGITLADLMGNPSRGDYII